MKLRAIDSLVPPLVALALALGAIGCALVGGSPEHVGGRATLGDAAAAAKPDSSHKQKRLDVGYTVPPDQGVGIAVEGSNSYDVDDRGGGSGSTGRAPGGAGSGGGGSSRPMFGLVAGAGAIGGTGYDGFGEVGIMLGGMADRWRFDVIGSLGPIAFADETIAGQSFVDEIDLNLDLMARYYLTAGHTFLGAYPLVGVRFGTLFWDYAKPVPVFEDGERRDVKDDQINHFSIYGGFGFGLVQTRHLHLGAMTMSGVRFYSWDTKNGFSNTLFAPAGFVQGRLEAAVKF